MNRIKLLASAPTKELFEKALLTITDKNIIGFIEEPREIWALGKYYPCPYSKGELDNIISELEKTTDSVNDALNTFIKEIKGNVNSDYNSLEKIEKIIKDNKQTDNLNHSESLQKISELDTNLLTEITRAIGIETVLKTDITNLLNNTINDIKISTNPVLTGTNIKLTGYVRPTSSTAITATDTINVGFGKVEKKVDDHIINTFNPHNVTATQVGLGNVTNESKSAMFTSPTFTGTPTAPTADINVENSLIATTEYVKNKINSVLSANDAMIFKGVVGNNSALPTTHKAGWTYKVGIAGTFVGVTCEVGDLIICISDGTTQNNSDWMVVQTNIDGAVTGPISSVDNRIAVYNGASGKIIKDGGVTISELFTDFSNDSTTNTRITIGGTTKNLTIQYATNANHANNADTANVCTGNAASASSVPLSGVTGADDLKAIEGLTGTNGFLKKTGNNTWTLDTNTYLTSHQDISGKADKSSTVTNVVYNADGKKFTKTINGSTTDIITASTIVTDGGGLKTHQTVIDNNPTLLWGNKSTVATIGSTNISVTMPTNPVTDDAINSLGYSKTKGTVTGVKVNGTTYNPSDGIVDLGTLSTNNGSTSTDGGTADKVAHKLKFTGASTAEYDGSSEITVNIPQIPNKVDNSAHADNATNASSADKVNHKLKFVGGATGEFDGSSDVTITIPSGGEGSSDYATNAGHSNTSDVATKVSNKLKFNGAVSGEYDGSVETTITVPTNADTIDNYHVMVVTSAQYDRLAKDANTIYFVKP